ncbi:hypothetical protein ABZ734_28545 [Streptomyces sp. NPDC006660]|uniref:hypothetical protein n=1 Tax=Streptomyces sp. NPDC006660 TaxID=3156901 RepID=UPI0033F61196
MVLQDNDHDLGTVEQAWEGSGARTAAGPGEVHRHVVASVSARSRGGEARRQALRDRVVELAEVATVDEGRLTGAQQGPVRLQVQGLVAGLVVGTVEDVHVEAARQDPVAVVDGREATDLAGEFVTVARFIWPPSHVSWSVPPPLRGPVCWKYT